MFFMDHDIDTKWVSKYAVQTHTHRWISQKRCKLGSPNLHHQLPKRF